MMIEKCIQFLDLYKEEIINCLLIEEFYNLFTDYLEAKEIVTFEDFDLIALQRDEFIDAFLSEAHCLAGLIFKLVREKIVNSQESDTIFKTNEIIWCIPLIELCTSMQSRSVGKVSDQAGTS